MTRLAFPLLFVALWCAPPARSAAAPEAAEAPAATPVEGRWQGHSEVLGTRIPFAVEFARDGDGCRATAAMQGHTGLPLENVECSSARVRFELAASIGRATWEGAVEGGAIVGTFAQNDYRGTFRLEPAPAEEAALDDDAGSVPPGPTPYAEEAVRFDRGDVRLAGTITVPAGEGPFPAVVLLNGSGQQDRDSEIVGFRPFRILADAFARAGVAVLRYDDRGIGGSRGSLADATSADFAADAEAAFERLRAQPRVDPARVGLLGHSEGGMLAPMVASRNDAVAFLVLLAPPAVDGSTVLVEQVRALAQASGLDPERVAAEVDKQRRVMEVVRSGEGWDEVEAIVRAAVGAQIAGVPAQAREGMRAQVDAQVAGQIAQLKTPWFRYFARYDPAPALRALRVPVLAMFGGLDTQVPPEVHRPALEAALVREGASAAEVVTVERANHLFQEARTGSPLEYAGLPKRFADGVVERIVDWVVETNRPAANPAQ